MPKKSIPFNLDFLRKENVSKFNVKQFDSVTFLVTPFLDGVLYNVSNMKAKIYVGIENEVYKQETNISLTTNLITVNLDSNIISKKGIAYAEIELTDTNGTITSSSFIFTIDTKIGEGAIIPGNIEGFVEKYERLISEFKTQVNNIVLDSQTRTTNAINVFATNSNNALDNFNSKSTSSLNTFNTNANNKLTDVENRFQKLTASQQQSSEVIDARNALNGTTYSSLKARLDAIETTPYIFFEDVEG